MSYFAGAVLLAVARSSAAQAIPATIEAAEIEGAAFPRRAAPVTAAWAFSGQYSGTADRKCVVLTPPVPEGSLRSGDFIIRSHLLWDVVPQRPPFGYKILWVPVHNPFDYRSTLLIRASRVGAAADSIRQSVDGWAYQPGHPKTDSSFPSLVRFPAAGQWLVVATAGDDWGCFLLTVA